MMPAMVPVGLECRSLAVPHSLLVPAVSSPSRLTVAGGEAPERSLSGDSRPWPRPQPPQPPLRARSMTLRPPRQPPAPSWLQHHLRDRGRGEESGAERALVGGAILRWAGPVGFRASSALPTSDSHQVLCCPDWTPKPGSYLGFYPFLISP